MHILFLLEKHYKYGRDVGMVSKSNYILYCAFGLLIFNVIILKTNRDGEVVLII